MFLIFSFSPSSSLSVILLVLFSIFLVADPTLAAPGSGSFTPQDNHLIDCGSSSFSTLPDGRVFKTNDQVKSMLDAKDDISISVPSADVPLPIYLTARVFKEGAAYDFPLSRAGWHWVRLHFFPLNNSQYNLKDATFSVNTDEFALMCNFNMNNNTSWLFKEFLVNATQEKNSLKFIPKKDSIAFINAIEVVSAPDVLIGDQESTFARWCFPGAVRFCIRDCIQTQHWRPSDHLTE